MKRCYYVLIFVFGYYQVFQSSQNPVEILQDREMESLAKNGMAHSYDELHDLLSSYFVDRQQVEQHKQLD